MWRCRCLSRPTGAGRGWCCATAACRSTRSGTPTPEAPRSVEETPIGGLGIMMVKRLMDAHSYRYVDGCNEVTIAKRW